MIDIATLIRPHRVAHAHSGTHSYAYIIIDGDTVSGNVQYPVSDINKVIGIEMETDEAAVLAAIQSNRAALETYTREHFRISSLSEAWTLDFTGFRALAREAGSYAILEYRATGFGGSVPRTFTIEYDGIIHDSHHHEGVIVLRTSAGVGPLTTTSDKQLTFDAKTPGHTVTIPDESTAASVLGAGTHVASGAKEYLRRAKKKLKSLT